MKSILISTHSMEMGGIETALIGLLKALCATGQYQITLCLEDKSGEFLNQIPEGVKIITFAATKIKLINAKNQAKFRKEHGNKYDLSICYATYSLPCSFAARTASEMSVLWVHNDYLTFYNNDAYLYKKFFRDVGIDDYKKVVFVSEKDRTNFMKLMPEQAYKAIRCNNLIDYVKIYNLAKQQQNEIQPENIPTFIVVSRMDEPQKKITRIIEATRRLDHEGYRFRVFVVGGGPYLEEYKNNSSNLFNLQFLGGKENPYPYMVAGHCLLMSSEYEGYPMVWLEALTLGKPIVTTDVSDAKTDIEGKYGIVVEKSEAGVYMGMKQFMQQGYRMQPFSPQQHNQQILSSLTQIVEGN